MQADAGAETRPKENTRTVTHHMETLRVSRTLQEELCARDRRREKSWQEEIKHKKPHERGSVSRPYAQSWTHKEEGIQPNSRLQLL